MLVLYAINPENILLSFSILSSKQGNACYCVECNSQNINITDF